MSPRARLLLGASGALVLAGLALWLGQPRRPPEPSGWPVPDFRFPAATAEGPAEVSRAGLAGRVWIANFIFTHCAGPCPLLTRRMAQWRKSLPPEVALVSFSVDPDRDTVDVLGEYARRFGASGRWYFATGERDDLAHLFITGFKLPIAHDPMAPSGERVAHSTRFVLVDKEGEVRKMFNYDDPELDGKMSSAVAGLLKE